VRCAVSTGWPQSIGAVNGEPSVRTVCAEVGDRHCSS
jgi:hypothetical protein